MALPTTTIDFTKIFSDNTTTTKFTWSNESYLKGWETVGSTPPAREMFDALQRLSDQKDLYLKQCIESLNTSISNLGSSSGGGSSSSSSGQGITKSGSSYVVFGDKCILQYAQGATNASTGIAICNFEYSFPTDSEGTAWYAPVPFVWSPSPFDKTYSCAVGETNAYRKTNQIYVKVRDHTGAVPNPTVMVGVFAFGPPVS